MVHFTNKLTAIKKMNQLAQQQRDFFFLINYEMDKCLVCRPEEAADLDIFYRFPCGDNCSSFNGKSLAMQPGLQESNLEAVPPAYSVYKAAFHQVQREIKMGNTYLINLCFESKILNSISLPQLFKRVKSPYCLLFKDDFLVFSPESFVKIKNNRIYTYPMKGTINADLKNAEETLLSDEKELAEHYTIVDLLRNDLSIFASNVRVNKFRYLQKIKSGKKSLYQTSSEIEGTLPENFEDQIGEILFSMLPAGSITGAPKKKTVEILSKVENFSRGFYTGITGVYSKGTLDSAVLIRFIEKRNAAYYYKSGGGITFNSTAENEYRELIDKIYVPIY